uniref:Uncharacterized protein n=1 Tax=Romanomermis culicivorax TaxID=13658 RepID=A0A915KG26_ROMCU
MDAMRLRVFTQDKFHFVWKSETLVNNLNSSAYWYKPALAEQDGVLRQDYQLNWQTISDHLKHEQHLQVISKLETLAKQSLPQQFVTTQAENEQED